MDEIWSLRLAGRVDSVGQVFTALHHDNNHYLNTLWLWVLGPEAPWPLYRLPAFAAGVGTVYLVGRMELETGAREAYLAAGLFAVSYPFVHYASEARGYAVVVLLGLAAFALLGRHHRTCDAHSGALFGLTASVGFLAHLTFLTVYLPLLAWTLGVTLARRKTGGRALRVLWAHLAPLTIIAVLVLVDVRYLVRGGGPELPPLRGWLGAWAHVLGIPTEGAAGVFLGTTFLVVLLVGLRSRAGSSEGAGVFFVLVLLFPVCLLLALGAGYAPPRYFLASLAFGLLLVGRGCAALLAGGRVARLAVGLVLAVAVAGNGWRVARFLQDGRGAYGEAAEYLAAHTGGDTIRVTSDHDFRSEMVLDWYRRFLPDPTALEYVPRAEARDAAPEWYLLHELGGDFDPPDELGPAGPGPPAPGSYTLRAVFPKYGLSGWHWAVYRRSGP